MLSKVVKTKILQRIDTEANWNNINPILLNGEIAFVKTTNDGIQMKVGNGSNYLDTPFQSNIKIDKIPQSGFNIEHISQDEYHKLVINNNISENTLYILSSNNLNLYNEQIKNVAEGIEDTDGVNLKQVNDLIKVETDRSISVENELDNKITEVDSKLDDFALKTDITEIENDLSNKIKVDGNNVDTLNIQKISRDDYYNLVLDEAVDNNTLYIISSDNLNAYGQQIKNVADGIEDTDAANIRQLSYKLVDIELVDNGTSLTGKLENRTISKITIDSDEKPIVIAFPNIKTGYARDFILQINVSLTSTDNLQIEWEGLDDNWNAISDADDWAILEPGLNIISFTEMN